MLLEEQMTENPFTARGITDKRRTPITPWLVSATTQGIKQPVVVQFPLEPADREEEDLETYLDISVMTIPDVADGKRQLFAPRAAPTETESLDAESVPLCREPQSGQDARQFARRIADIIKPYPEASAISRASDAVAKIWFALLNAPKTMLVQLRGNASKRQHAAFSQQQLYGGKILRQQYVDSQVHSPTPDASAAQTAAEIAANEDEKAIRRSRKLAREGHLGRGSSRLAENTPPTRDPMTMVKELQDLHPTVGTDPDLMLPGDASRAARKFVGAVDGVMKVPTSVQFVKSLTDARSGAAPGGSGWTDEMMIAACEHSPEVAAILPQMITDLANDCVPESVRRRLAAGDLVGIPKVPSGTRPITMCETFSKHASRMALDHDSARLKEYFGDIQVGVSFKNGAERIIHDARAFIRDCAVGTNDSQRCVALIDFKNAFNCPDRQGMWNKVRDFPALRSIFAGEYKTQSELRPRCCPGATIWSRTGARQGTACGPAFFCIALHPVLLEASRCPGVRIRAYMDDVSVLADDYESCQEAVRVLLLGAAKLGLEANKKKCEVLSRHNPPKNAFEWNTTKGGFERKSAVRLLGAAVGINEDVERTLLAALWDNKHDTWLRRIREMPDSAGTSMLALCGVPKGSFIARVHHPNVTLGTAMRFDGKVRNVFEDWGQLVADDVTDAFMHLPRKLGGLGFSKMVETIEAAYTASYSAAKAGIDGATPATQRLLMEDRNNAIAAKLDAIHPVAARTRHLNSHRNATCLLSNPAARSRPQAFSAALRFMSATPHASTPNSPRCPGCQIELSRREFAAHCASCARVRGTNASSAHQWLKIVLKQLFYVAGIPFESNEPHDIRRVECPGCRAQMFQAAWLQHARECKSFDERKMSAPYGHGPDIRAMLSLSDPTGAAADTILIDVTQCSMTCASAIKLALHKVFEHREAAKTAKYGDECDKLNQQLLTFAVSSEHGIPSKTSMKLIEAIAIRQGKVTSEVLCQVMQVVQEAHGAALYNAESKAGIMHKHKLSAVGQVVVRTFTVDAALLQQSGTMWLTAATAPQVAQDPLTSLDAPRQLLALAPGPGSDTPLASNASATQQTATKSAAQAASAPVRTLIVKPLNAAALPFAPAVGPTTALHRHNPTDASSSCDAAAVSSVATTTTSSLQRERAVLYVDWAKEALACPPRQGFSQEQTMLLHRVSTGDFSSTNRFFALLASTSAVPVRKLREMFAKFEDHIGHSSTARDLKQAHHEQIYAKDVHISHELVSPQRDSAPIPYDRRSSLILSPDNSRLVVASDVLAFAGSPIAAGHATGVVSLPFSVGRSWGDLRAMFNAALNVAVKVLDSSINEQEVQAAFDHNPSALIAAGIVSVLLRQNKAWHNGGYITRDVLGIAYTAFVDMLPPNMFNKSDALAHDASVHAARTLLLITRLADAGGHTTDASHPAALAVVNNVFSSTKSQNQNQQSGNNNGNGSNNGGNGNCSDNGNGTSRDSRR